MTCLCLESVCSLDSQMLLSICSLICSQRVGGIEGGIDLDLECFVLDLSLDLSQNLGPYLKD